MALCSGESDSETERGMGMADLEEGEREGLMERAASDTEVYSMKKFVKARSFHLALAVSFIVIIAIFVLLAVTAVVVVTLSSSSSGSGDNYRPGNTITLDDVFNQDFVIHYYSGTWTADNRLLERTDESGVRLYDPSNDTTVTLVNATEWARLNTLVDNKTSSVVPSSDFEYLLLVANIEKVFRHSFLADYYIYSRQSGVLMNVTLPANPTGRIQYAQWSPSSNLIAYVLDNDIYIYDVSDQLNRVTTGGAVNELYHGVPDWVYEEEVLGTNTALWWSEDGANLLFATFNDTEVREYKFPKYGPADQQYTDIETIAYPKPGTVNPTVGLYVVDISDPTNHSQLSPPATIDKQDHYFVFAGWANSSAMFVTWMNRSQQAAVYCIYDLSMKQCDQVYEQRSPDGWIEVVQEPKVFDGGGKILALVSQEEGSDNFIHIAQLSVESGDVQFITNGTWEVTNIIGTSGSDTLYISTQTKPWQRHVYSTASKECLTCPSAQANWNAPKSTNPAIEDVCDYFSASCSRSLEFCVLQCHGPAVPYTMLMKYDQEQHKFEKLKDLENNTNLLEVIANKTLPTVDTFEVSSDEQDEPSLNGRIIYPPNFDPDNSYPVLVYVYGGPNSQTVANTTILSSLSRLYFVSNLSLILVSVDGRGTGFRGDRFKYSVYRNLGEYETVDQLRAGRHLQGLKYVDSSKLAIYGASYGGYMAGMVGSSGSGVYSAAISQSPVSDWHYYDSIYTERYMSLPGDNPGGYKNSSVLGRARHLSEVDYLLIHGTGDDNVHFQHTAQLARALTQADVQFRMQIYTDKTHSLAGEETRRHLYGLITDFLRNSFDLT